MTEQPTTGRQSHLAVASDAVAPDVLTKTARWPELHSGDCQQDNGTLSFRSDGTGDWSCTTLTYQTHTHDVWHASFDVYAGNGAFLFHLGTFDSPGMSDGNPPPQYPWGAPFSFNPDLFDAIANVTQHYSC
jgi:hypothetical protein